MSEFSIAFDAKRAFHNYRGLGNYSRTLIEGLQRYYPDIALGLYTPHYDDQQSLTFTNELTNSKIITPSKWIPKTFQSIWRTSAISSLLEKSPYDLYHGLSHELPLGIDKTRLKKVVTIHDLIYLRYPEFFPWIDRKIYQKKFVHSIHVADKVLAICDQTKQDIIRYFGTDPQKISVVYQACHPRFYDKWNVDRKKSLLFDLGLGTTPFILYVGAFEKRKNLLNLIHAFASIAHLTDHNLVLVGSGKSYLKLMLELVGHYKLINRVKILSQIETDWLPGLYQSADLFVFPSFYEGFGIPIVEALFSEVPVITSEGSCFPESGGPGSEYIDPNSVEQLRESIMSILSDQAKKHLMISAGRNFVEKFHLAQTSNALMNFYGSVMSDKFVSS
jgi:glycosyltransferase involved in cell wall biosynthesis